MSIWQSLADNEKQLKVLFVVIMASFALFEYLSQKEDRRIERALKYVQGLWEGTRDRLA